MKPHDSNPSSEAVSMNGNARKHSAERSAENLLAECLELSESRWSEAILEACRDRPDLARSLEQLFDNVRAIDAAIHRNDEASAREEIPPGTLLGDFDLLERVGGGGMGVVYRAHQRSLDRTVALKLIRPEHLHFERSRQRFRRETEAISRLHHPGIVPLFEAGESGGLPYFTMEFIAGQSIGAILNSLRFRRPSALRAIDFLRGYRQGSGVTRMPADEGVFSSLETRSWTTLCCRVIARIARALEHAHVNGVVHRDVKPSNVMVTDDGRVVVVDFGLALSDGAPTLTRSGSHPGSLPYMSPEQLSGAAVDHRTDVYSLGVTLYEMLTLRCPFPIDNTEHARRLIAAGSFDRPRSRNPAVSLEVEAVCLKAMDRDPARRYATAAGFAEDLVNAVFHRPITARTFGPCRLAMRLVQRHPARSLAAFSLIVAFVVGPILFAWQQHRHAMDLVAEQSATNAALTRAMESEAEARAVLGFLTDVIGAADPASGPHGEISIREALTRTSAQIEARFKASPRIHAHVLQLTSRLYYNLGLMDLARRAAEDAALIVEATFGKRHVRMVQCLCLLSERAADNHAAEAYAREAVGIVEDNLGIAPAQAAWAYGQLANVLTCAGQLGNAEEAVRKAIVRAEASTDRDQAVVLPLARQLNAYYATLGELMLRRGSAAEARRLLMTQRERSHHVLPSDDGSHIGVLSILNEVDRSLGYNSSAKAWAELAHSIATSIHGHDHPYRLGAELMSLLASPEIPLQAQVERARVIVERICEVTSAGSDAHISALVQFGNLLGYANLFDEGCEVADRIVSMATSRGASGMTRSRMHLCNGLLLRSRLMLKVDRLEEARRDAMQALTQAMEYGATLMAANAADVAASADAKQRRTQQALELMRSTMRRLEGVGGSRYAVESLRQSLCTLLVEVGSLDEAGLLLGQCLKDLEDMELVGSWRHIMALVDHGKLAYARGDLYACQESWSEALRYAMVGGVPLHVPAELVTRLAHLLIMRDPIDFDRDELLRILELVPEGKRLNAPPEYHYLFGLVDEDPAARMAKCEVALRARYLKSQGAAVLAEALAFHFAVLALGELEYGRAEELARSALNSLSVNGAACQWLDRRLRVVIARSLARQDEFNEARRLLREVAEDTSRRGAAWEALWAERAEASSEVLMLSGER